MGFKSSPMKSVSSLTQSMIHLRHTSKMTNCHSIFEELPSLQSSVGSSPYHSDTESCSSSSSTMMGKRKKRGIKNNKTCLTNKLLIFFRFVRLQSVYNNSPTFQSSTQFNDVFVFKVRYQKVIRSSRIVILFYRHLLVKSDIQPRVFANFVQKFCCPTKCEGTWLFVLFCSYTFFCIR